MSKTSLLLYSVGCICFFACFIAINSQSHTVTLNEEKLTFTPLKFYIADVADARVNRNLVALLIVKNKTSRFQVDLKNGAVNDIKNFINHNLKRDTTLRPLMLIIKEFKLTETHLPQGMVGGDLKVVFSYSAQLSYQNKHLVDFIGDIHYKRPINKPINVEAKLRRGIVDGLTYINNWVNKQRDH